MDAGDAPSRHAASAVYCSSRMKEFLANNGPWSQLIKQDNISPMVLFPNDRRPLTPRVLETIALATSFLLARPLPQIAF